MPQQIVKDLLTYVQTNLVVGSPVEIWDGEVPRQDVNGVAIVPQTVASPSVWPVMKGFMQEGGFSREWTFGDAYTDEGEILIQIWGASGSSASQGRQQVETVMNQVEVLLAQLSNWPAISSGGPPVHRYYVVQALLVRWYSGMLEGERTYDNEFIYVGNMYYLVTLSGAVSTA